MDQTRLELVRGAGRWMPWMGLGLAVVWWGCVAGALITVFDLNMIARQPPITLAAGTLLALLPGILMLMASFMARESARAAAANALVLSAADQLLAPATASADEAESLAQRLAATAEEVDRAMGHAISAMKALSGEIGDERLRLESVTYAAADNARDLTERLQGERSAIEALIRDLSAQNQTLNESIPNQVGAMVEAARVAGMEVAKAEDTLEQRLESMKAASEALVGELAKLDGLAGTANSQSEQLLFSIARIEEKIDESRRTVESAVRAGETAAAAAGTTGDAVRQAVAAAIADAERATNEIHMRTREASDEAERRIAELRQSAEQAGAALKTTGDTARQKTARFDYGLPRPNGASATPPTAVEPPAQVETPVPPQPAPKPEPTPAPAVTAPEPETVKPDEDDGLFSPPPLAPSRPPRTLSSEPPRPAAASEASSVSFVPGPSTPTPEYVARTDEDLFEGGNGAAPTQPVAAAGPGLAEPDPLFDSDPAPGPEVTLGGEPDAKDDADAAEVNAVPPSQPTPRPPSAEQRNAGWTSILSDMDRHDAGELPREETAEMVIRRLEGSGIALASVFRPRDKKRIANAARKGDTPRRNAILSAARTDVERVSKRLRADQSLEKLARDFVSMEEPDAIAALDRTHKSNRNASPRLSAFLLLDAAIDDRPHA